MSKPKECVDHKGNKFKSIAEMCRFWHISDKTYRDRIKYMGLLDNVELVNLNCDLYLKWRSQMNKTNLFDRYKTDIQKFIK